MKVKLLLTTFAMVIAAASVAIPHAHAAGGDDVFMDDGEGDFDSVPVPSSAPKKDKAAKQTVSAPPIAPAPPVAGNDSAPAVGDEAAAVMGNEPVAPPTESAMNPEPVAPTVEETAMPVAPAPAHKAPKAAKQAAHKKSAPSAKVAATSAGAAGKFLTTKDSCEMHREPASESEKMITIKPARKIWTETVDENWVRAFNKAGEPGFISKDCF